MSAGSRPLVVSDPVIVVGAGIGGLCAALSLASDGVPVRVIDSGTAPGGKIREVNGAPGGPTVLTMKWVFDALYAAAGESLGDRLRLVRQDVLARHFWRDGAVLDLHADPEASAAAIREFAGARGESEFRAFSARAKRLFEGFLAPVMTAPRPDPAGIARALARQPRLVRDMAPGRSLAGLLERSFTDPRLRQLFGRYATYVGGSPHASPALLSLIWEAEAAGVWTVAGGLTALAADIAGLIEARGGEVMLGTTVDRIEMDGSGVTGVRLSDGRVCRASAVVFNGDPRALATGLLGDHLTGIAKAARRRPRALSARVWSCRGIWTGPEIRHHNVFFRDDPRPEFEAIAEGRIASRPTHYLCAADRGFGSPPPSDEAFEIIINAAPLTQHPQEHEEFAECLTRTHRTLETFGARIDPAPEPPALTTQEDFEALCPGSAGSLYGQSPHGAMAAFARPTARTKVPGLYLAGGGVHPGPGVPMAALSGRHAAEAIRTDRASRSPSRRTATRGGMSTGSATTAPGRSRS
ncbi:methoxyneurosporene dehydrogenase [Roseivivax halodurans JCM 10272]|uniref:Methoxyneurosporene dehydrogenase n=1 Tax=Roseivivax halodurans JCM 10272 TaxID=1449350 RepID=X7EI67_9RHOB|nr:1-hydroxycarotenoid 3,4-desaturase CrtD [Roseivivax halodurans]ETX15799.1 methoxyneurosporene dehydrogenase [Roseivivax halodurans JCM 10272]